MAFVTFGYNPVSAPACYPPDLNGLAQELTTGGVLTGQIPDTAGGGIFVGSSPPSSALTNKVWFKTDSAGRPLGVYMFYNGNWRKIYTGVGLGEIRMWSGVNTVFDGTGRGLVGGDLDGWALCNGSNATPDLTNRFIAGSTHYNTGWQANPDQQVLRFFGGDGVIRCVNLPDLWTVAQQVAVQRGTADVAVATSSATGQPMNLQIMDLINNCQPAGQQPLAPPWWAMAYIMFVGYQ